MSHTEDCCILPKKEILIRTWDPVIFALTVVYFRVDFISLKKKLGCEFFKSVLIFFFRS